jgi:MarR family transcriptional regulator, temperature-dependent positive regulator of motility
MVVPQRRVRTVNQSGTKNKLAPRDNEIAMVLPNYIGFALRLTQCAVFRDFYDCLADEKVTTAQFSALCIVRDNPGLNQTALADALQTETSRIVKLVDMLEQHGYLERLVSTRDRRSSALYLTSEGAKRLEKLCVKVDLLDHKMSKRLRNGSREVLLRMLRDLATPDN